MFQSFALVLAIVRPPASLSPEAGEHNTQAMRFYDAGQFAPAVDEFFAAYQSMPDARRDLTGRELLLGSMRSTLLSLHEQTGEAAPLCRLQTILKGHEDALLVAYPDDPDKLETRSARARHEEVTQQLAAADAGIDNALNFKAWISDALFTPANMDNGFTKAAGTPYVRPDGVRIADDWNDLILNGPDDGISVTEAGVTMPSKGVWTGTAPNGGLVPDTLTCQGWKSSKAADKGHVGLSGVDIQWVDVEHWTSFSVLNCLTEFPIYCFEQ